MGVGVGMFLRGGVVSDGCVWVGLVGGVVEDGVGVTAWTGLEEECASCVLLDYSTAASLVLICDGRTWALGSAARRSRSGCNAVQLKGSFLSCCSKRSLSCWLTKPPIKQSAKVCWNAGVFLDKAVDG